MGDVDSDRMMALQVFARLRGPIMQDLAAMRTWAAGFDAQVKKPDGVGALNYTLAMTALVGCEALGFLLSGGSADRKNRRPKSPAGVMSRILRTIVPCLRSSQRRPDVGRYISETIKEAFPTSSKFKHLDRILSDYLRHALIHGFGSHRREASFDVHMIVSADAPSVDVLDTGGRPALVVNSVALADETMLAFDVVERRLATDATLWSNFALAETIDFPAARSVNRQFEAFRLRAARSLNRSRN
jgi:hypothetical protein